jgi:Ca-activated chloride channel family protein
VRTVSFASPYLLLALLVVPLVLALALWFDRRRARYAVAYTNLDLLASVVSTRRQWRRFVPLLLFLLALACAATALARPRATISVPATRATVVLLVDVSGSMRAADVKPSRLGAAQHAMSVFADRVPKSVKIGLVSFSTGPNVLVIPTTDRAILHEGIDLLEPEAGTAIGDGLAVAVQVVRSSVGDAPRSKDGKIPGAIVLLSDGAQTRGVLSPLQGAARARVAGIRVFTIALGTRNGTLAIGPYFGFGGSGGGGGGGGGFGGGRRFPVRPDPVTLAAIARDTGGQTFRATSAERVDTIYRQLGSSIAHHAARREVTSWFVGAAALLLLGALGLSRWSADPLT